tara:strand:- start:702 stop:938 length:237 start_codon:yes stop_codon:yes gene_type:complete
MAQGRTRAAMVQARRMKSGPKRAKKKAESKALIEEYQAKGYRGKYKKRDSFGRVVSTNTSYNTIEKGYMNKDPYGQGN